MTAGDTSSFGGTQVERLADRARIVHHRLHVTVVAGPDRGLEVDVESPTVCFGTAETNDVRLQDDTVSRHHCEVVVREGRRLLRDLRSTNGTWLEGVEIAEAYLEDGARVRAGETEMVVEAGRSWTPLGRSSETSFGELVGTAPAMREVFDILGKVSRSSLTVLVVGETGTGKDLAARGLHAAGRNPGGPFVVVDCGALQRNLVESELFGHEKGAFTGADRARPGAFEAARGGTVFLDEIGELPLDLQPRLLRILEQREVRRLGSQEPIDVDVRIVAATHRDIPEMVDEGGVREDLYCRLSVRRTSAPSPRGSSSRRARAPGGARWTTRRWPTSRAGPGPETCASSAT